MLWLVSFNAVAPEDNQTTNRLTNETASPFRQTGSLIFYPEDVCGIIKAFVLLLILVVFRRCAKLARNIRILYIY